MKSSFLSHSRFSSPSSTWLKLWAELGRSGKVLIRISVSVFAKFTGSLLSVSALARRAALLTNRSFCLQLRFSIFIGAFDASSRFLPCAASVRHQHFSTHFIQLPSSSSHFRLRLSLRVGNKNKLRVRRPHFRVQGELLTFITFFYRTPATLIHSILCETQKGEGNLR